MARITRLLSALSLLLSAVSLSVQAGFSSLNRPCLQSSEADLVPFHHHQSQISFASFFTFSPNFNPSENTTLAFVLVPSSLTTVDLTTARKTWSVEFTTLPTAGGGPAQGFQVSGFADGSQVSGETYRRPTPADARTILCRRPHDAPYEVLVEYNATAKTVFVASPSCDDCPSYINFTVDLSSVVEEKFPLQVGFIASDGACYNVSNANFSVITAPTSYLASILPATPEAPAPAAPTATSSSSDSPGRSTQKIGKGYVVAFSVLGSGIAVAAAFGVFLLCRRLAAAKRSIPAAPLRRVQDEGTAVVVDATKLSRPPPPPPPQNHNNMPKAVSERHTATPPAFEVSGTTSWFQPVTAR